MKSGAPVDDSQTVDARLQDSLRTLRRNAIAAIGAAAAKRSRRAMTGAGASWAGYSTLANAPSTASFNEIERAVDRAVDDVLRTAMPRYGGNGGVFVANGGPAGPTARALPTATAVAVAPYAVAARQPDSRSEIRTFAGLDGRIAPAHAILIKRATPVLKDIEGAAHTIAGAARDDKVDEVQSLLKLIALQVSGIRAELEGPEPPRAPRVEAYLDALGNGKTDENGDADGLIAELADAAGVQTGMNIVSPQDEVRVTTLDLLTSDARDIARQWHRYRVATAPAITDSLGQRLVAASRLMPVIADATAALNAELAAEGFTRREAASASGDLSTIDGPVTFTVWPANPDKPTASLGGILPDISFDRLLDWLETWTADEGPRAIAESSSHGLEEVTDQANALWGVVIGVLASVVALTRDGTATAPRLAAVLASEQVEPILGRLVGHLDSMAGLA
jgi:hypothetical protein